METAVRSPSVYNLQPWRFRIGRDCVDLFADRSRALPVADPDCRELIISCGAALFYLRLALRNAGCTPRVDLFPRPANPDWLARVRISPDHRPSEEESRLFHAMDRRHTNRISFLPRAVSDTLPGELAVAAKRENADLRVIASAEARAALIDLIGDGARAIAEWDAYREEMRGWLHPQLHNGGSVEGILNFPVEIGAMLTYAGALGHTMDAGGHFAEHLRRLAVHAPLLTVLTTNRETPSAWLAGGQALARILLLAAAQDVQAAFLDTPIQVSQLREQVESVAGGGDIRAQLVLAFGYAPYSRPTPRRPLSDVLDPPPSAH